MKWNLSEVVVEEGIFFGSILLFSLGVFDFLFSSFQVSNANIHL